MPKFRIKPSKQGWEVQIARRVFDRVYWHLVAIRQTSLEAQEYIKQRGRK